ncbi:sensor histidine kinase [Puerhibacterium puerhi]|uniref:sensor histidine kinase n=1 Tax=Puerhibacterium puerhi TaxID=2692623 RepID=UPI001357A46A|nr:histidine kinase [Puerhibacterium puerhi]
MPTAPRHPSRRAARLARRLARRLAWLMLGAAIGLAAALLAVSLVRSAAPGAPVGVVAGLTVAAAAALGLVPGARELEVTAARTMLGTDAELVLPRRPRAAHRVRTVAWVLGHQVAGLAVAAALFAGVPFAVLVAVEAVTGRPLASAVPPPAPGAGQALRVLAAAGAGTALLLAAAPVGAAAAVLAGRVLGPTPHDRLEAALARADREAEHVRLARELHDGIGHALTIVGVQAAAGRRVVEREPALAARSFEAIEDAARQALGELDALLGALRQDRAAADDRLADTAVELADVVAAHRRAGLEVTASLDLPDRLPALLHRAVRRVVAEALANAHRHGGPGAVRLVVATTPREVTVDVSNPLPTGRADRGAARRAGGRGLAGVRERAALFGGAVDAGVRGDRWVLRAVLPRPEMPEDHRDDRERQEAP